MFCHKVIVLNTVHSAFQSEKYLPVIQFKIFYFLNKEI